MKRIVNFRPFLYFIIGLTIGIYSYYLLKIKTIVPVIIFGLVIVIYTILAVTKTINKWKAIVLIMAIFLGFSLSLLNFNAFSKNNEINKSVYIGKIDAIFYNGEINSIIVTNCKNANNYKLNGNIYVSFYGVHSFMVGDIIRFEGELNKTKLFTEDNINNYYYKYNISYTLFLNKSSIEIIENKINISEKIKLKVNSILHSIMDSKIASISYSVLFGDSTYIDEESYSIFSQTGLIHLLAISGLNITLIYSIISIFLDKIKIKRIIKFFIISFILLFYLYLCEFTISAFRATLMAICFILSKTIFYRYDILSSLSLSLSIMLIVSPFSLFSASFQLTALSVLSILLLYPVLKEKLCKTLNLKENFLIDNFCLTLVVQLFTLPVLINLNGEVNLITILLNLIAIPIFDFYFLMLFICVVLSLIFPYLSISLVIAEFVFNIFLTIGNIGYLFPIIIKLPTIGIFSTIIILIMCFVISKFVMIKQLNKIIICSLLSVILIFSLIFSNKFLSFRKESSIYFVRGVTNSLILNDFNNVTLINIGNIAEINNLIDFLKLKNISKIESIIFSRFTGEEVNNIIKLNKAVEIEKIYIDRNENNNLEFLEKNLPKVYINFYIENENFEANSIKLQKIKNDNGSALYLEYKDINLLLINSGIYNINEFQKDIKGKNFKINVIKLQTYTINYEGNILGANYYFVEKLFTDDISNSVKIINNHSYIKVQTNNILNIKVY